MDLYKKICDFILGFVRGAWYNVPSIMTKTFGATVRGARKRAGFTQAEVGSRLGLRRNNGYISGIEKGSWYPKGERLRKLCRVLGLKEARMAILIVREAARKGLKRGKEQSARGS